MFKQAFLLLGLAPSALSFSMEGPSTSSLSEATTHESKLKDLVATSIRSHHYRGLITLTEATLNQLPTDLHPLFNETLTIARKNRELIEALKKDDKGTIATFLQKMGMEKFQEDKAAILLYLTAYGSVESAQTISAHYTGALTRFVNMPTHLNCLLAASLQKNHAVLNYFLPHATQEGLGFAATVYGSNLYLTLLKNNLNPLVSLNDGTTALQRALQVKRSAAVLQDFMNYAKHLKFNNCAAFNTTLATALKEKNTLVAEWIMAKKQSFYHMPEYFDSALYEGNREFCTKYAEHFKEDQNFKAFQQ
jgi:hypothetical protein